MKRALTAVSLVLLLGCTSETTDERRAPDDDARAAVAVAEAMSPGAPTRELFTRFRTLRYLSPDLLDVLVEVKRSDPAFVFRLNVLVDARQEQQAKAWLDRAVPEETLPVQLIVNDLGSLPGNTFVQDSFHVLLGASGTLEMLVPDHQEMLHLYRQIAAPVSLAVASFPVLKSTHLRDPFLPLAGYPAGGNWRALPQRHVATLRPVLFEKFLAQLPARSGPEFELLFGEELHYIKDDHPDLSMAEARARALELVTSPSYVELKRLEVEYAALLEQEYEARGYRIIAIDSYSEFGGRLTNVDHIDEHFVAFGTPRGGSCALGLLVPDPMEGWNVLQAQRRDRSPEAEARCQALRGQIYEDPSRMASLASRLDVARTEGCFPLLGETDDMLASRRELADGLEKQSRQVDATIAKILETLGESGGCRDVLVVRVPSFRLVNVANSIVLTSTNGASTIVRPDTHYPPFEAIVEARFARHGIESVKVNSLALASGGGNVHCAAKTVASP